MRNTLFAIIVLTTGVIAPTSPTRADEAPGTEFILAVHPYLAPAEIVTRFTPLADFLGKHLGRKVNVRVGPTYAAHVDTIGQDAVDIAFMGPVSYVELTAKYGPKPLLARLEINGEPVFRGSIIVRKDSPLTTLRELKNKRFAFGEPDSTMGTIVPRYMLLQAGVTLDALAQHQFITGHKNVALAVLSGSFDAGAVKDEVFRDFEPQGLRLLATTPAISEHLFVTRANMPQAEAERLRQLLLGLRNETEGAAILRAINKQATALVAVQDSDYTNLREILAALNSPTP